MAETVAVTQVTPTATPEQKAAHAAAPVENPLPGSTFIVKAGEPSRLPAGSTLEVPGFPGVHVPHPHAEVNLPGYGDPRVGATKALTETVVVEGDSTKVEQKPLADEVRVRTLSAHPSDTEVGPIVETVETVEASSKPVKVVLAK